MPSLLSLGELSPGQAAWATLTLANRGPEPCLVARIESGCPYLRISPASVRLEPGATATLTIEYDPTESSEFRGGLNIKIVGRDVREAPLFRVAAQLNMSDHEVAPSRTETSLQPALSWRDDR